MLQSAIQNMAPIVNQLTWTGALAVDESKKKGRRVIPFGTSGARCCSCWLYLGIRQFLVEACHILGSMLPGLQIQDRLLVEKLTYRARSPKRGEIVVFNSPHFDPAESSPEAISSCLWSGEFAFAGIDSWTR